MGTKRGGLTGGDWLFYAVDHVFEAVCRSSSVQGLGWFCGILMVRMLQARWLVCGRLTKFVEVRLWFGIDRRTVLGY